MIGAERSETCRRSEWALSGSSTQRNYGAVPTEVCDRAAVQNSQADMSHSAAKNPVRNTITPGQFAPVEPYPAIRAITPTNA